MMSPFLTCEPRRTRSSCSRPLVRAKVMTLRSASVRPESISLRLWATTLVSITATRKALVDLRLVCPQRRFAFRRFMRDEITGQDHKAAAATRPTAVTRLPFMATSPRRQQPTCLARQQVTCHIHENRNQRIGSKQRVERPPPPDAIGDDHQHVDRALDVRVAGDIALLGGHVEHGREPFPDVGIERRRDARDLRIAPGFGHDFGAELHLLDRANGEVVTRHAFEHGKKPL